MKIFILNSGKAIIQMRNGANTVFTYLKNILLQCDTVSNKTSHISRAPEEAGVIVGGEDGTTSQNSIGGISENKANVTLSTGFNGASAANDGVGLIDINAKSSARIDVFDESSSNMSRATFQGGLMEDVENQPILEMKNMTEENRKETKDIDERARTGTKILIEEMKSMIEDIRKENKRLDGNVKDLYKRVKSKTN